MIVTTDEAATELGVTPSTIRTMVDRKELTPLVPGARPLRFTLTDVWEAQARRVTPQQAARLDALWQSVLAESASV